MQFQTYGGVDQRIVGLRLQDNSPRNAEATTLTGRTEVDPSTLAGAGTVAIAFFGQSTNNNGVNSTLSPASVANGSSIFNLSIGHKGACFVAKEPLLSSDLLLGHHGMYIADSLITNGYASKVVLINSSLGGSVIADWAPGGNATGGFYGTPTGSLAHRIRATMGCLANAGLLGLKTILDLQIGEWDSDSPATTQSNYAAAQNKFIAECKNVGLLRSGNVLFINQCTRLTSTTPDRNAIRAAQASSVDGGLVRLGFDFDTISNGLRYDGTHVNTAGAQAQAAGKYANITNFLTNG